MEQQLSQQDIKLKTSEPNNQIQVITELIIPGTRKLYSQRGEVTIPLSFLTPKIIG